MTQPSSNTAVERVRKYISEYEDAPNWGGPTMYPAPPSIADLKELVSAMTLNQTANADALKVAFWASLTNANAVKRWLDHDSMDEMIEAAWTGFEQPATAALNAGQTEWREAGSALLEAAEKHIFGDECKAERDRFRKALSEKGE